ncbi:MAG: transposase [Deltaproteobacteria bacterium]|nr:transposase [Deltaproteobacteria bacterium]
MLWDFHKNLSYCRIVLRDPKATGRLLPWIHKVISNAKSVIRETHHVASEKHLHAYLCDITYRFNHRFRENA